MSTESQIRLKSDGWEIKTIDVKKYAAGEGDTLGSLNKLSYSDIIDLLQQQSHAETDLVVIDVGDLRKLVEEVLVNTVKMTSNSNKIKSVA